MQSKQKKAQGKRQNKSKPRPKAQKQGKPKRSRGPNTGIQPSRTRSVSAPAISGVVRSGYFGWKFGTAPSHDEFPEGGLRIIGQLPGSPSTTVLNGDYSTSGFGLFSSAGYNYASVSPCATSISNYTVALFSVTSPLAAIAQFFRRFRFRKLEAEYNGQLNTASVENRILQLSYERDSAQMQTGVSPSAATQDLLVNSSSVRFNSWQPNVIIPLIRLPQHDKADELWFCNRAGDVSTASVAFDRQNIQGIITSALNNLPTAAETVYGTVLWRFEVDLYGFNNTIGSNWSLPDVKRLEPAKLVRSKFPSLEDKEKTVPDQGDRKDSLPDCDLTDFVELTPKSNRLRVQTLDSSIQLPIVRPVQATPPLSARVSSKK